MSIPTTGKAPSPAPKKGVNKNTIIIGLLSLIIIIQGVKWYTDSEKISEQKEKISSTETELASTLQRLTEIGAELDEKIKQVQKLGGDVSDLTKAKEEIEKELKNTRRANGKVIKELKGKVEGYEVLLKNKDKEIEKLQSINKVLLTENVTLKNEKNELGDSISRLSETAEQLQSKVELASQLKIENMVILGINEKGRERRSPFKNRQIDQLKIEFNLSKNDVAPIEGKKIMIRIIDENNQVLFDLSRGSGTVMLNDKEEFYTASQEILFDNSGQKLTYLYEKGSDYAPGAYLLEVYTDDYLMGKGEFVVK